MLTLSAQEKKQISRRLGIDLLGAGILTVGLAWNWIFTSQAAIGSLLQAIGAVLVAGNIVRAGLRSLLQPQSTNYSDQLVAIAVVAAFSTGDFVTATLVPLALDLGRLFEERTAFGVQRTIENIRSLQTELATKIMNGKEIEVESTTLQKGDRILIRAGERIPADGVVVLGHSQIDQSAMTGESKPEKVTVDSQVFAGTRNLQGFLHVEVSQPRHDSALGRIIRLLEESEKAKLPILNRIEGWLAHYMPLALALAASVLFFTEDIQRAIAILIVSFPASLALAGPATMVASFSRATSFSLFLKNGVFFQLFEKVDTVVFDKTGTLTYGQQRLSEIQNLSSLSTKEILHLAASVAQISRHPISESISRRAKQDQLRLLPVVSAKEEAGRGILAQTDDATPAQLYLGRLSWLEEQGVIVPADLENRAKTWLAKGTQLLAGFSFEDQIRESSSALIAYLRATEKEVWMLTGDHEKEAIRVSTALDISHYQAEALPDEKWQKIKMLREEGKTVLMIGDGINDALAIQEADVGIAFGASLSQAVAGGADAALLSQNLGSVEDIFALSRSVWRTIIVNIGIAFLFAATMLILAGMGQISALTAALVHNVGAILVIVNSSLLLMTHSQEDEQPSIEDPESENGAHS